MFLFFFFFFQAEDGIRDLYVTGVQTCALPICCPARPSGTFLPKFSTLSSGIVDGMSGVQIGPGATLFTRMPFPPKSCARLAAKFAMAAFVAAYGANVGDGMSEFTDELPMMDEPGAMCGTAALQRWNIAETFVANV